MIIGLTGTIASGKSLVADLLKDKGFSYLSLSDEVRTILTYNQTPSNESNLHDWEQSLKEKNGFDFLAKRIVEKIRLMDCGNIIIDNIKNSTEAEYLKSSLKNFFLVGVDAPQELRYNRMKLKNIDKSSLDWLDFLKLDEISMGFDKESSGHGIAECMKLVSCVLINDKSLDETKEKVEILYSDLLKKIQPLSWDEYFMTFAKVAAQKSKDPSTKVGACIVDKEKRVVGLGYNGFPKFCNDFDFPLAREGNFLDTKYAYVVHAEPNAILNSTKNTKDCVIYVTLFPCNECAKLIIQSGIREVIYLDNKYAGTDIVEASRRLFKSAGVKTRQLNFE